MRHAMQCLQTMLAEDPPMHDRCCVKCGSCLVFTQLAGVGPVCMRCTSDDETPPAAEVPDELEGLDLCELLARGLP